MRGLYLRGGTWWLSISVGGQRFRGSTGVMGGKPGNPPRAAEMFRAQKLAEMGRGNLTALVSDKLTVGDILQMLEDRYSAERRHSLVNVKIRTRFLRKWHGTWKVSHMTADRILAYAVKRRDMGAAIATVNVELTYLRRAFSLAADAGRIVYIPRIRRLPGTNVRQGFVRDDQLAEILEHLPEHYRPLVRFLRLTGWRLREGSGLERRRVDWEAQEIRLETSKTGKPRTLPFSTYPALAELLMSQEERAKEAQRINGVIVSHVFHRPNGKPVNAGTLQRRWSELTKKLPLCAGVKIHDLRRTLVREMEQKGVPRSVAMTITGHRSEEVYRRYAIVARQDVEEGLRKLAATDVRQFVFGIARAGEKKSKDIQ